jgi:hypothetical protein
VRIKVNEIVFQYLITLNLNYCLFSHNNNVLPIISILIGLPTGVLQPMMIITVLWMMSQKIRSMARLHLHLHLLRGGLPLLDLPCHQRTRRGAPPPQAKSPAKKKATHGRKKVSPEKLPYEKSEEESKAAAQKEI